MREKGDERERGREREREEGDLVLEHADEPQLHLLATRSSHIPGLQHHALSTPSLRMRTRMRYTSDAYAIRMRMRVRARAGRRPSLAHST
jgi:hypothetical protein